ncbi:MAG: hypothetical protein FJZ01_02215 [Candidatus Sericytochromatia bacterium]|nr:hypothetical protein [Candidatus Tanganyikabacteria bacterium]
MQAALTAGGRSLAPASIVKIQAGREPGAYEAARRNGLDDVFFRIGQDTYVASGRGLSPEGARVGANVQFGDRQGQVVRVDQEVNTASEGAWMGIRYAGLGAAIGILGQGALAVASLAPWAAVAGIMAMFFLPQLAVPLLILGGLAAFGKWALVALGVGGTLGAAYGHYRKGDDQILAAYGEVQTGG